MADQKNLAISYCLFFISIYVLYICYSVVGGYINTTLENEIVPSTIAMNATNTATMALADFSGLSWFVMVIIVGFCAVILSIILMLFGRRAMGNAF